MAQERKGRLSLDLGSRALEKLKKLKDETEATSMSEVLRNALLVYEVIVRERKAGKKFVSVDEGGAETRLFFLV